MIDSVAKRVLDTVRSVPGFPRAGILFKDITPLLANAALLGEAIRAMHAPFASAGVTHVVGIESRGFLFGVPIALALQAGFVPARKAGKLPWRTMSQEFQLEYGTDSIEVHVDAFTPGSRVLIVDDVLATGGTAAAACHLVERLGGVVVGLTMLLEIAVLDGRARLGGRIVRSLVVC